MFGAEKTYYNSLQKDSYGPHPKDYVKAKPALNRLESCATNYELGQSKVEYESTVMNRFMDPPTKAKMENKV